LSCRSDPDYFRTVSSASNTANLAANWVPRYNQHTRLYKLIIRYFEDQLRTSTASLPAPNLQLIAKGDGGAEAEACILAGLVLALAVRSNQAEVHVTKIQGFDEWVQKELMMAIEQVGGGLGVGRVGLRWG
jgi:protein HOOK3